MNIFGIFKRRPTPATSVRSQTTYRPLNNHRIRQFLDLLELYTVRDLQELQRVSRMNQWLDVFRKRKDKGTKRCSTAAASLCFAIIEQVGLILRTDLIDPNNPTDVTKARKALKNESSENAESFFAYANRKRISKVDDSYLRAIYILFRNKITHNLFPGYGLGVTQDTRNNVSEIDIVDHTNRRLNINALQDHALRVLLQLRLDIDSQTSFQFVQDIDANLTILISAEETNLRNQYHDPQQVARYPNLQTELRRLLPTFQF